MKATSVAPSNIAFIKYWGKEDEALRIPLNDSISMNLSGAHTTTTVEFSDKYPKDSVELIDGVFSDSEVQRVVQSLDRVREKMNVSARARVVTQNTFPKGAGAAASASGFAALTMAAFAALESSLSEKELTIFARIGSGSACRSIPDGFVIWEKGVSSETSYAYSLYPSSHWDLCDMLLIVDAGMKKVTTSDGMSGVKSSPKLSQRLAAIPSRMQRAKEAIKNRSIDDLGKVIEEDCVDMHEVMRTQNPPIVYWNDKTKAILDAVTEWRKEGLSVYFTIDAGPNVHLIYEKKDDAVVQEKVKELIDVSAIITNSVAPGARLSDKHLF